MAALGMNFRVVPDVVFGLMVPAEEPVIHIGVFVVLLTPCIDYVITFTDIANGDAEQITATTPALMLMQLLLLPVYLWVFMGQQAAEFLEVGPFVEVFVVIIVIR